MMRWQRSWKRKKELGGTSQAKEKIIIKREEEMKGVAEEGEVCLVGIPGN